MLNIYIYWIGDQDKISSLVDEIKGQGLNVILGPTKEEDEILEKKFKYYKDAKKQKIYSYMSDVWRIWKLKDNKGLYIDTSVTIGKDFSKWVSELEKSQNNIFFKEGVDAIASCLFYSNGEDFYVFEKVLDTIKKYKYEDANLFHITPNISTWVLKDKISLDYKKKVFPGLEIRNILEIRNPKTIKKLGSNSWNKWTIKDANRWWDEAEKKCINDHRKKTRQLFYNDDFPNFSISGLRSLYDKSARSDLKNLSKIYKNRNFKVKLSQRLIWSKIYRLFIWNTKK